jgi:hypothetical protein
MLFIRRMLGLNYGSLTESLVQVGGSGLFEVSFGHGVNFSRV